jgi:Protein of unknown function (DUF4239)
MVVLLLVMFAICACAVAFAVVGVSAMRRLVRKGVGDGHNDVSSAIFQVGGTIYAVFLAFLVIAVWEAHDAASSNVAEEASLLCTLYRGSMAMEQSSGEKLRTLIRQYTHMVIEDEWPIQARTGGASAKARQAGLQMFEVFGAMPPQARQGDAVIDAGQLSIIDQIQDDRNKRTLEASESISPVIWAAAIVNGLLVVLMSFFLYPDQDWPHVVMSGMLTAMIVMLLYVIFTFERPFRGAAPLEPRAFVHSLEVYDTVDRTR